jgi:hypothetical protein
MAQEASNDRDPGRPTAILRISGHRSKKLIVAVRILITSATAAVADSDSSYRCPGFEPYPPVGCSGPPKCLCDSEDRCSWVFTCGREER